MIRIAICDDEHRELQHLEKLVREYDSSIAVSLYPSAESLLESMNNQISDIVLLDIELDGINGFAAAEMLVNIKNPPLIVFVTNSAKYTYRGYEVAFRYLPKPVNYTILSEVLNAAISKITPQKITITTEGRSVVIPLNDVLYCQTQGRRLVFHTKEIDYKSNMKLSELSALLPGRDFASPHKGVIVNLDYVDYVGDDTITLIGDIKVPLSRRNKKEFEQALFRFVRRAN